MAIESAKNALSIYLQSESNTMGQNVYGIALQNFQLGYLFETYAETLCSEYVRKASYDDLLESVEEYHTKAKKHFNVAHNNFKKINHIKGQSMALLHESNLIKNDDDMKARILRKVDVLDQKYEQYVGRFGTDTCCHVPREQGEVVSLLTEIVYSNVITNMFPRHHELDPHLSVDELGSLDN